MGRFRSISSNKRYYAGMSGESTIIKYPLTKQPFSLPLSCSSSSSSSPSHLEAFILLLQRDIWTYLFSDIWGTEAIFVVFYLLLSTPYFCCRPRTIFSILKDWCFRSQHKGCWMKDYQHATRMLCYYIPFLTSSSQSSSLFFYSLVKYAFHVVK